MTDEWFGELTDEDLETVVGGSKDTKILMEAWRKYLKEQVVEHKSVTKSEWTSHTPSNTLYIDEAQEEDEEDEETIDEVYSEKQRKWACAQIDNPTSLTKAQAKEMCSGPIKK